MGSSGLCIVMLLAIGTRAVAADADPLDPYRDRFQAGLNRFREGDMYSAIQYWEGIRRELGDKVAYRLLFNLARAYDSVGDLSMAADHYEAFLKEAEAKATEEPLAETVQTNVATASSRLADIFRNNARIRVLAFERPRLVQVDQAPPRLGAFRAIVAPGRHVVTVDRQTANEQILDLELQREQEFVVDLKTLEPEHSVAPPVPQAQVPSQVSVPDRPPVLRETETRPFSGYVLVALGGATAVSMVLPWLAHGHATSISDEYKAASTSIERRRELANDYDTAKTLYSISWFAPAVLAGTTGAFGWWYVEGTERVPVTVSPNARGGAVVTLRGQF